MSRDLSGKIKEKQARIAVIGLGRVGLPTAAIFADAGFSVTGVDIKKKVVAAISSLEPVANERGLDELVKRVTKTGKLKTSADAVSATKQADIVLVCVQTPLIDNEKPDLRYLESAIRNVAKGLLKGKLVVVVSTVPPGTTKNLVANLLEKESGLKCGRGFKLAYSPERILQGNAIEEFVQNTRLVGGFDSDSTALTVQLFAKVVKGKILTTDIANAELAKLAENTFRFINIAFADELALICEKTEGDIAEVISLANTHPRVNIHKPGPGIGGPCLTKDPQLLLHPSGHSPFKSKLIQSSGELDSFMAEHVVNLVVKALSNENKKIKKSSIGVLGVAYKAEVSDTTNSPAQRIIQGLKRLGMKVRVYDPYTNEDFGAKHVKRLEDAVVGADCVVVATDHKMFADLPFRTLKTLMNKKPAIIDAKRVISSEKAKQDGFAYYGIGFGLK